MFCIISVIAGFFCHAANGIRLHIDFAIADVSRPLLSVGRLMKLGYQVVFEDWPYIQNKNGRTLYLEERRGAYVLPVVCCWCSFWWCARVPVGGWWQ